MSYKIDVLKEVVIINDNEYSYMKDFEYQGEIRNGRQRPYLRRNTKIDILKYIKEYFEDEFEEIKNLTWYITLYKMDVELEDITPVEIKELISSQKLNKEMENMEMSNELTKVLSQQNDMLESTLGKLAGTVVDMGRKIEKMNTNTKLEDALIEGIVSKGKELAVDEIRATLENHMTTWIKETYGELPDRIVIEHKGVEYDKTGLFHKEFDKIVKLISMKLPVMLTGGAGAGKNFMLEQVADVLNLSFYYTSTITQEYKLTGFIDGGGKFHETEFYKAFTQGGIFMLDEIDASIPECLVILNGAIANGYFDFPTGREIAHEDFRVACAGNTVGLGADMVYTGRNVLDGATLDRFVLVDIDYDPRIEANLCQDEELRDFLYDLRKSIKTNKINHIVGMRTFKYAYEMLVNGFEKEFIVKSVILKGLQQDDINVVKSSLRRNTSWKNVIL